MATIAVGLSSETNSALAVTVLPTPWPVGVPESALISGYSEQVEDNVARFQPEVGPAKLRRRTSFSQTVYQFGLIMTTTEYDSLLTFYRTTLKDGTLSFKRKHPRTQVASKTFLFMKPPTSVPVSATLMSVSLALRGID